MGTEHGADALGVERIEIESKSFAPVRQGYRKTRSLGKKKRRMILTHVESVNMSEKRSREKRWGLRRSSEVRGDAAAGLAAGKWDRGASAPRLYIYSLDSS